MTLELLEQRKKEDTLKAQRDTGWSLMTNTEGWVLELDRERKKRAWRGERKKARAGERLLAKEALKQRL